MNTDDPSPNPYTEELAHFRATEPTHLCSATSFEKVEKPFAARQLQKLLTEKTRFLMQVPHKGPLLSDSQRTYLERDLADAVAKLAVSQPHDLLTVILLLDTVELVLTTLVMDSPEQYSMSQLWGIASKYMGSILYRRNIEIRQQPHWIAMRRAATRDIIGYGNMFAYQMVQATGPEDFDSLEQYLTTLGWAATSDTKHWCLGIYEIVSKIGPVLGNGGLLELVDAALSCSDPVTGLEGVRLEVEGVWRRVKSEPKSKKRRNK